MSSSDPGDKDVRMVLQCAICERPALRFNTHLQQDDVIHAGDIIGDYQPGDRLRCETCGEMLPQYNLHMDYFYDTVDEVPTGAAPVEQGGSR